MASHGSQDQTGNRSSVTGPSSAVPKLTERDDIPLEDPEENAPHPAVRAAHRGEAEVPPLGGGRDALLPAGEPHRGAPRKGRGRGENPEACPNQRRRTASFPPPSTGRPPPP